MTSLTSELMSTLSLLLRRRFMVLSYLAKRLGSPRRGPRLTRRFCCTSKGEGEVANRALVALAALSSRQALVLTQWDGARGLID